MGADYLTIMNVVGDKGTRQESKVRKHQRKYRILITPCGFPWPDANYIKWVVMRMMGFICPNPCHITPAIPTSPDPLMEMP